MIIRGAHDDATIEQMQHVAASAAYTALMADGHRGYYMPIGGVAAFRNVVSPHGVGVDIACGNMAVKTDLTVDDTVTKQYLGEVADEITAAIGFGMGQPTNPSPDAPTDHPLFRDPRWDIIHPKVRGNLRDRARAQLGTVGGGNHYVDIFSDEDGAIWVGCHFGSRGLGYITSTGMIGQSQGTPWRDLHPVADWGRPVLLGLGGGDWLGPQYWDLMELCGEYAYAGREWVTDKVCQILGAEVIDSVHNHHNFAWKEQHFGEEFVVVRKGATPAFPGQRGFVGGSMGDISVILRGSDPEPHNPGPYNGRAQQWDTYDLQRENLYSTVHGAGRVMGRMQAKGKWKKGKQVRPGLISPDDMAAATKGLVLRGGDLDEAPQAYRPLREVLEAQGGTIVVEEILQPLVVCMAPSRTRRGR